MRKKQTLEDEINSFLKTWNCDNLTSFLRDIIPLFQLYDVDEENDWVEKAVGGDEENVCTIRLIRTVYLVSKIASFHSSKLCAINAYHKDLWKKMEKQGLQNENVI